MNINLSYLHKKFSTLATFFCSTDNIQVTYLAQNVWDIANLHGDERGCPWYV